MKGLKYHNLLVTTPIHLPSWNGFAVHLARSSLMLLIYLIFLLSETSFFLNCIGTKIGYLLSLIKLDDIHLAYLY